MILMDEQRSEILESLGLHCLASDKQARAQVERLGKLHEAAWAYENAIDEVDKHSHCTFGDKFTNFTDTRDKDGGTIFRYLEHAFESSDILHQHPMPKQD
jgi:hypothetical protein